MFILCKGKVSIRNESGDEIAQLHKGQFFGEFALIYEARRSATVKSIGVTEVSVLHHVVRIGEEIGGEVIVLLVCVHVHAVFVAVRSLFRQKTRLF